MILVDTSVLIDFFKGTKNMESRKFEVVLRIRRRYHLGSALLSFRKSCKEPVLK